MVFLIYSVIQIHKSSLTRNRRSVIAQLVNTSTYSNLSSRMFNSYYHI
uniref:Uncharacterized protein n=1 Tax=Arundo donax TaxID=35708 RepID=A0A0A9BKI1_ARUDO